MALPSMSFGASRKTFMDYVEAISIALMIVPATLFALVVIWLGVNDRWK